MSVCSEVPFDTFDQIAAFSVIAVDHDPARPAGRMIEGQAHSLFKRQYLLATMNSGFGSSAGYSQKNLSTSTNFNRSNEDAAFFVDVMPGFANKPNICSTPCTNTTRPDQQNNYRGAACGHISFGLYVWYPEQSSHLERRLGQYCHALDPRLRCKSNMVADQRI
ncbi:hypothetical protein Z949_647 [Sulfitobacter guttiformis KCTC 32187]|uniref:Uncharacterized protein n=1 Tax=Sulfitobacter guttiformis TaxID=74349 RepID=A0A420DUR8_9RHOB|nr:hypothetical protein Z949_647 [Sulfitobacter guttiformis KCTC 32187]RKE97919.1 hypothetical protein C8N30_2556 [Sulfitobacter guttiformis]